MGFPDRSLGRRRAWRGRAVRWRHTRRTRSPTSPVAVAATGARLSAVSSTGMPAMCASTLRLYLEAAEREGEGEAGSRSVVSAHIARVHLPR
jgi:hypothetical protein